VQSVIGLIKKHGPDILDKRDESGDKATPFLLAAEKDHVDIMSVMYESKPDVLQQTDHWNGCNAMHWAAWEGHVAAVNKLLEWDPKLIDARSKTGWTAFMFAAFNGHVAVMEALYTKRKDLLTQTNNCGETALHGAARNGRSAAVSQLLEWGGGALLDIKNNDGQTPWDYTVKYDKPKIREIMRPYKR